MSPFGDPRYPRRNLWGGLVITGLASIGLGMTIEFAFDEGGPQFETRYIVTQFVLDVLLILCGVLQFRLGLKHMKESPESPTS